MDVCRATEVRPGDLLFEPGDPKVAGAAGDGTFGHVSVAISPLCWLQVGLDGVGLESRPLTLVNINPGDPFWGFEIPAGAVLKRNKVPPSPIEVRAHVAAEVGRSYATRSKLLQVEDITAVGRRILRNTRSELPETDLALLPGRMCSESSAIVAGLGSLIVSPDALAAKDELDTLTIAIVRGADYVSDHPMNNELESLVAGYDADVVPVFAARIAALADVAKSGGVGLDDVLEQMSEEVGELESEFQDRLRSNMSVIVEAQRMEVRMFAQPTN